MKDPAVHDGFKDLLQSQDFPAVPDFLEANIMATIEVVPIKSRINISLQSVFILSSLASVFVLLGVLVAYYPTYTLLFQDLKTMTSLVFLVKLCYDLNEVMPSLIRYFFPSGKAMQH